MMAGVFGIPDIDKRTTICGRTGSGKSQAGAYILSQSRFDVIPYVVLDFKREAIFSETPGIRVLSLEKPDYRELNQPGVFMVRPTLTQENELEDFLWQLWDRENVGLFVDEGYMIGKSKAYVACLTQGRSKHIPVITLTQRPRFISPFAFSEADYLMIFQLTKPEDKKTVQDYVDQDISERLPPHWSYWYDVGKDQLAVLRPVPSRDFIIRTLGERLDSLNRTYRTKQFV
jgi:hypothetical protein